MYIGGEFVDSKQALEIINPHTQQLIASVAMAGEAEIERAIQKAVEAKAEMKALSSYQRSSILNFIAAQIKLERQPLAELLSSESAKPLRYALAEIDRAIDTFSIAAEEAKRLPKEYLALDWTANAKGKEGIVKYFPAGLVAGITPFNFPLNLVAHKVAPAIAAGCPLILKPASATPLTALALAKIIHTSELPKGAFSVLPCSREVGSLLVKDNRIAVLSFTGSPDVGWQMKKECSKKKIVLELGGNAAVIVDRSADVQLAIEKCLVAAFAYSGQVCIHAQRIYVVEELFDNFLKEFTKRTQQLITGNPLNEKTEVAELIDEKNAVRIEQWVNEALQQGAQLICGGKRKHNFYEPSILTATTTAMKINAEEVFGPIVCIEKIADLEEGIQKVNDSRFGLQAGLFSNDAKGIQQAFYDLEVGGLIINDVPTFRVDQMPYGGIKDSGLGREGIKYALYDYLEPKLMVQ